MARIVSVFIAFFASSLPGVQKVTGQVETPSDIVFGTASTPSPTGAPCTPLLFDQRQYRLQTTESFIGVLTVLIPAANSGVSGYNVRTPGYESSLILNNITGILQKARKMPYQRVELLVQGETATSEKKNATNTTDIVDVDETLIIMDIMDENDSPPLMDCSLYGDSCDNLVVGFPASPTAVLPAPLLRFTVTDADTGSFGVTGIQYSVNSTSFSVDPSGLLWLVEPDLSDEQVVVLTAKDNLGRQPYMQSQASITALPVTDRQLFFVSAQRQLTTASDVTELLEDIRSAGGFSAVLSPQLQGINYGSQVDRVMASPGNGTSQLYVYAICRDSDGAYRVVERDEFQSALGKMAESDTVRYVESKEDQMNRGGGEEDTETGLIVALAVVSCLLAAVIVAAVFREYTVRRRSRSD
ncbi:hypothetical protein FJT64_015458 [Amphibalanus amphitrite]|uniref:Cadherin domain-containing protein n=2 Tax=Amphibalanus amphitrite TaxID=1232801 RepID=A0A6A4X753_AMPAM|nr:hypothetical protein FJT64_015458 [Amphibalanus amphitrite]